MLEKHIAVAHHDQRRMQSMGLAAQGAQLVRSLRPVGRLGETPRAERQRLIGAQHQIGRVFAPRPRVPSPAPTRPPRRQHPAPTPLLRCRARRCRRAKLQQRCRQPASKARRAVLFEARTRGSAAIQSAISCHRLPPALGQKIDYRGGGFFNRAAGDIDQRPIMFGAEFFGESDLRRHRVAVDILMIVLMRAQPKQAVLPDLHDTLWAGKKPDDQRFCERFHL